MDNRELRKFIFSLKAARVRLLVEADRLKAQTEELKKMFNPPYLVDLDTLSCPLGKLELRLRLANHLRGENIYYIGDLIQRTESELLKIPKLERRHLDEIKEALSSQYLELGTKLEGWVSPARKEPPA